MEKKFIIPAVTFILPFLLFIGYFITSLTSSISYQSYQGLSIGIPVLIGGFVLFSGISCYRLKGPRMGSIVRGSVLLVFAILAFWKISFSAGLILAISSFLLALIAVFGKY